MLEKKWLGVCSAILIASLLPAILQAKTANKRWSGGTCTAMIAERNTTFDRVKRAAVYIDQLKKRIANDEAQIKLLSGLSEPKEEAAAQAQLASSRKTLAQMQAVQSRDTSDLKRLDAEIEKCKGSGKQTTPSVSINGQWAGNWNDGNWTYYHIFLGQGSLSYTYQNNAFGGSSGGQGRCTVQGNVATCTWTGHLSADVPEPDRERSGHSTLTLSTFRDNTGVERQYILMRVVDNGQPRNGMSSVQNYRLDRTK